MVLSSSAPASAISFFSPPRGWGVFVFAENAVLEPSSARGFLASGEPPEVALDFSCRVARFTQDAAVSAQLSAPAATPSHIIPPILGNRSRANMVRSYLGAERLSRG